MDALQASFNLAKLELDYTQIKAPIKGVIAERYVKLGNTINAGDPMFRVTSLEPLVAYLPVPEREYRHIEAGQVVTIEIDALQGEPIIASVSRVSPIVDPETGTFKITVEIIDQERRIKPGMFGRISIVYDKHENALQLPRSALVEDAGQTSVFVVEDDVAIKKVVHAVAAQRDLGPQRHIFANAETSDGFLCLRDDGLLTGDLGQIFLSRLGFLGVFDRFSASTNVQNNLV